MLLLKRVDPFIYRGIKIENTFMLGNIIKQLQTTDFQYVQIFDNPLV